jgi:NAD(P)H-flavin reductase
MSSAPVSEADAFVEVAVVDAWDETPALRGLALDVGHELAARHLVPGQVVQLRARGGGHGYFAIACAPVGTGRIELLLKRGSALSDALIAEALPGEHVAISPPFGRGFPVEAAHGRDLFLFAVGSGITPIRALVQHVIGARQRFGHAALFYGQRAHEDFAYAREHNGWDEAGVRVILCASQPSAGWNGQVGYVQDVAHALAFLDLDLGHAVAFLCGTKAMVSGVSGVLTGAGMPAGQIFLNF